MKTKTYPQLVKKVKETLGNGNTINHETTPENRLGQSGVHTFADDIMDIVLNSKDESQAFKRLLDFLMDGSVDIK